MIDFNFRFYGHVNISSMQEVLQNTCWDWEAYDFRQKTFDVHKETQTIPLIWNERDRYTIRYWDNYPPFAGVIEQVHELIGAELKQEGRLHTAILIKMKPGTQITPHYDTATFFRVSKRIHIPILTNEQCLFTVSDETIHMKAGEVWEINNDGKVHGVINNGASDRVHLLIDWKEIAD